MAKLACGWCFSTKKKSMDSKHGGSSDPFACVVVVAEKAVDDYSRIQGKVWCRLEVQSAGTDRFWGRGEFHFLQNTYSISPL
jgi:hypothetical protein